MALTKLYINDIVDNATTDNADLKIKALYGVKTVTVGGLSFIDGQSVIDALLATNVSSVQASALKSGAVVSLYGKYWILLEDPVEKEQDTNVSLKLITKDNIGKNTFGSVNNFGKSAICRYLNGINASGPDAKWKLTYPGLNEIEIENLQKFDKSNDLTKEKLVAQNGDATYENNNDWDRTNFGYVALLDETDFKNYYDTNKVLRKSGASASEPYWLMTGVGCESQRVVIAQPDGTLSSALCTSVCGVRPVIVAKVPATATIQVAQLGS